MDIKHVNLSLFRGQRPESFADLIPHEIKHVINLQSGIHEAVNTDSYEYQVAESFGMTETNIRCNDFTAPSFEQVERFLRKIYRTKSGENIYVHCLHGVDRTGFMIACYRISAQSWSVKAAIEEMYDNGFHKIPYKFWTISLYLYKNRLRKFKG